MKVLLVLCLIAVVVSAEEESRTIRPPTGVCKPGCCVLHEGLMCRCGVDGKEVHAKCLDVYYCKCRPGKVLRPDGIICTCPKSGVMRPGDCIHDPPTSAAENRASHSVDTINEFTAFADLMARKCDLYEVIGEVDGMLVCGPCPVSPK